MKSRRDELEIPTQRTIKEYVENVTMSPRPSRIDNFIVKGNRVTHFHTFLSRTGQIIPAYGFVILRFFVKLACCQTRRIRVNYASLTVEKMGESGLTAE